MDKPQWTCTDIDNLQYGRKLSDNTYEFKEGEENSEHFKHNVIDLKKYLLSQIEECINSFGYTLHPCTPNAYKQNIYELYHTVEQVNWIIAECLFELGY